MNMKRIPRTKLTSGLATLTSAYNGLYYRYEHANALDKPNLGKALDIIHAKRVEIATSIYG
jgi:hypothetical protein